MVDASGIKKENAILYTIGRKGADLLKRRGYEIAEDYSDIIEAPMYSDAQMISRQLLTDFAAGEISEIYIAYTKFKNTVVHVPMFTKLLPMDAPEEEEKEQETAVADGEPEDRLDKLTLMNFEPEEEEALGLIVPKYITSILYGAFAEAVASENGARMTAMDSATNNAEEMINDLGLKYNRARQSSITQELTEIIAGANAVG
jgi:F-type H+-transporting ATPase subunit gamma